MVPTNGGIRSATAEGPRSAGSPYVTTLPYDLSSLFNPPPQGSLSQAHAYRPSLSTEWAISLRVTSTVLSHPPEVSETKSDAGARVLLGDWHMTQRTHRSIAALSAVTLLCLAVYASTAVGTISYYRTGTLNSATTYTSVQRADWWANAIQNQSSTNIVGRVWSYNVITKNYVMQMPDALFYPTQVYGNSFPPQSSVRNYCWKTNGGVQSGGCYAVY